MGQPKSAADCAKLEKTLGDQDPSVLDGCPMGRGGVHIYGGGGNDTIIISKSATNTWVDGGSGRDTITVVDDSWGIPGVGPDGTLAIVGMAIAAITVTIIAWRALMAPESAPRR